MRFLGSKMRSDGETRRAPRRLGSLGAGVIAATLAFAPAENAYAQFRDFVPGIIIGGVGALMLGKAMQHGFRAPTQRVPKVVQRPRPPVANPQGSTTSAASTRSPSPSSPQTSNAGSGSAVATVSTTPPEHELKPIMPLGGSSSSLAPPAPSDTAATTLPAGAGTTSGAPKAPQVDASTRVPPPAPPAPTVNKASSGPGEGSLF